MAALPPLRVLGPRVLIRPDRDDRAPEETASGLVLAKSLAAAVTGTDPVLAWSRGMVIAVGTPRHPFRDETLDLAGRLTKLASVSWASSSTNAGLLHDASQCLRDLVQREPCVAVGDDVIFAHDAGQEITLEHQTFILVKEDELLAVVDNSRE